MTQPPPGPPPGAGGGYGADPRYPGPDQSPRYVPPPSVEPQYLPSSDPAGQEPIPPRRPRRKSPVMAPIVAFIGLILVAGASLWAMSFLSATLDDSAASDPSADPAATADVLTATASDDPSATAPPDVELETAPPDDVIVGPTAPPIVVEPPSDERADVKGSILFTRSGDIWSASGKQLRRLTNSDSIRKDYDPVWAPNGKRIYFIRTTKRTTTQSRRGNKYTLYPPDLMRMDADGSNKKKVYDALIKNGGLWFSHVRQPSVSPNGKSVVVVSDGPDGSNEAVTLHLINSQNGQMRRIATPSEENLGHNDPAYSPDGKRIAFTFNNNKGTEGNPRIGIFTCKTKANCSQGKARYLRLGYANPSWSPDGDLLAVESTSGEGRDIAIITAARGDVRLELTNDGNSFAPVFSPDGDQIAYLHRDGLNVDLRVMTLDIDEAGKITLVDDRPVTSDGGLDAGSTPSWFIPTDQLTDRTPAADASAPADAPDEAAATAEPSAAANDAPDGAPPPPPGS